MSRGSIVSEEPTGGGPADVADGVNRLPGNEDFLAWCWTLDFSSHLQLQFSLEDHQKLIRIVDEVFPPLAGWIDPKLAAESS